MLANTDFKIEVLILVPTAATPVQPVSRGARVEQSLAGLSSLRRAKKIFWSKARE